MAPVVALSVWPIAALSIVTDVVLVNVLWTAARQSQSPAVNASPVMLLAAGVPVSGAPAVAVCVPDDVPVKFMWRGHVMQPATVAAILKVLAVMLDGIT